MDVTIIARQSDGLVLAETWDINAAASRNLLRPYVDQAYNLLRKLSQHSDIGSAGTVCSNGLYAQGVVDSKQKAFCYTIGEGISILVLIDRSFPHSLVFSFATDLREWFKEEVMREFGYNDIRSALDSVSLPFKFMRLDRSINSKKQKYSNDSQNSKQMNKVQMGLADVSNIMRRNIDDIILRGENLEEMNMKAEDLKLHSKRFADTAKAMSFSAALQKYAPVVLGVGLLILLLFWTVGII